MAETNKIVLFEYDAPVDLTRMLNYEAGIWYWVITPGDITVTDDNSNTGYYDWTNSTVYQVKSFRYIDIQYSPVFSLNDCRITENSFFYDGDTTRLYVHREDSEPILSDDMVIGVAVGYSFKSNVDNNYNNQYYEPVVASVFQLQKSIDPLFYGLLKYQSGNIKLINNNGEFDDWRSRNLYNMAARILVGNYGDSYDGFVQKYTGYIENDKRSFTDFTLTIQDPRKGLTQGVATNLLNDTDYPFLNPSNNDVSKPVAYGVISNAPSYCLNETESSPSEYTFLYADTLNNIVDSIQEIRVDGVVKTAASSDLTEGTFNLASGDVAGSFDEVKVDFTIDIKNGVNILKNIMLNYDNKPFLDSFYDVDEVDAAEIDCRDTSLYVNESSQKLKDMIESVCDDCDIRFFVKDSGVYTARLYDADREPTATILKDDWIPDASIANNGNQFLTSCRIGYQHNIDDDTRLYYENTSFEEATFATYKSYKTDTFDTELTTLADAIDKSNTIMNISSNISDIVERTTNWNYSDIEPTDFVIAAPEDRVSSTSENLGIYEIMNATKNIEKFTVKLALRFVKTYTPPTITINAFVDEDDNYFFDENGDTWIEEIIT